MQHPRKQQQQQQQQSTNTPGESIANRSRLYSMAVSGRLQTQSLVRKERAREREREREGTTRNTKDCRNGTPPQAALQKTVPTSVFASSFLGRPSLGPPSFGSRPRPQRATSLQAARVKGKENAG